MKIKNKLFCLILTLGFIITGFPVIAKNYTVDSNNSKLAFLNEPPTPLDYYNLGRKAYLRLTKKGFQEAIEQYNKALSLDKNFALAFAGRAEAEVLLSFYQYRKNEKYSKARSELDAYESAFIATKLSPNLSEAHRALSMVYSLQERYDEGKEEAKKALELNKTDAESYMMLWLNNEKPDPNDQNIVISLSLNPNNSLALMELAFVNLERKNVSLATEELKRVTELTPENELAHMYLGMIYYYYLFNTNGGIQQFNEALEIDPENPYVHHSIGSAYFNQWNMSKAVEHKKKACDLDYKASCDWLKEHGNK